jgi:hypothetical protein
LTWIGKTYKRKWLPSRTNVYPMRMAVTMELLRDCWKMLNARIGMLQWSAPTHCPALWGTNDLGWTMEGLVDQLSALNKNLARTQELLAKDLYMQAELQENFQVERNRAGQLAESLTIAEGNLASAMGLLGLPERQRRLWILLLSSQTPQENRLLTFHVTRWPLHSLKLVQRNF